MRHRSAVIAALLATVACGCGNQRTAVPDVSTPSPPGHFQPLSFPGAGVRLRAPSSWTVSEGRSPLVAAISSGAAMIAVWRYPRREPLPVDSAGLAQARNNLLAEIRRRDGSLRVIRARVVRFRGQPGVSIAAFERVGGQLRRVRSLHLYAAGAEVVLDAYAPPGEFHAVDRAVFSPLGRSLRVVQAAGA